MRRILLAIEDYQELSTIQMLLMKFGWDVKEAKKNSRVKEEMLGFRPEGIIAISKGEGVDGIELITELRVAGVSMPCFLICNDPAELSDCDTSIFSDIFYRPIDQRQIIKSLARFSGRREKMILDRFEKFFGGDSSQGQSEKVVVSGGAKKKDYSIWLKSVEEETSQGWGRTATEALKTIRPEEKNKKNDKNRADFVKQLFTKKK